MGNWVFWAWLSAMSLGFVGVITLRDILSELKRANQLTDKVLGLSPEEEHYDRT